MYSTWDTRPPTRTTSLGSYLRSTSERPGRPALHGAGDLEVLADEDVVRATGGEQVDGVRAVAQLQHSVHSAGVLGKRCGLGLVRRRSRDEGSRTGTPAVRDLAGLRRLAGSWRPARRGRLCRVRGARPAVAGVRVADRVGADRDRYGRGGSSGELGEPAGKHGEDSCRSMWNGPSLGDLAGASLGRGWDVAESAGFALRDCLGSLAIFAANAPVDTPARGPRGRGHRRDLPGRAGLR